MNNVLEDMYAALTEKYNETTGEDFYFCVNARALGYPIFVNTEVQLDHMGDFTLGFDGKVRWEK
jgi:hypothetical protein